MSKGLGRLSVPHFFISSNNLSNNIVTIADKENYNHIAKSLRAKIGENILLIDEHQIQYEGEIEKITSNSVEVKIIKSHKSTRNLDFELYLAQVPLRSDAQSLIVEKATELGVLGIYPIFTDNCVLKKSVIEQKIPKWQKIMIEASKQCERASIPICFKLHTMQELAQTSHLCHCETLSVDLDSEFKPKQSQPHMQKTGLCNNLNVQFDRILAFTERSADFKMKTYLRENPISKNEKILVIIGPEGGFSSKEFDFFAEKNITTLSLGDLILKAETAVITAIGNIVYEYE